MIKRCVKCNAPLPGYGILCSGCAQVKLLEEQNELLRKQIPSSSNNSSSGGGWIFWLVLFAVVAFFYESSTEDKKTAKTSANAPSVNESSKSIVYKDYDSYRERILKEGWVPYVRPNQINGIDRKNIPELQYCFEDGCISEFLNQADPTKVRTVYFIYCSTDRYYQCPGQPNNFKNVEKDIVVSKNDSDKDFLRFLEKMSHYK